jgi:hypothetical protein
VHSYIPPCSEGFDYCLFRNNADYGGTNFESAGVRINMRPDLTTQAACLTTLPDGYSSMTPETHVDTGYATSVYAPLGDAGAGHYASGALYRLYQNGTCTEFETRIGETQFANYPAGSIKQFTDANRESVQAELDAFLNNITVSGTHIIFPAGGGMNKG